MGTVYSEINLINLEDKLNAKNGSIREQDIRSTTVTAMVDTGSWTLVINEEVREKLGLSLTGIVEKTYLADGTEIDYNMAGPLEVWWKDRKVILDALLIPNSEEVLLGSIPLLAMDLIIDPRKENLTLIAAPKTRHRV